ncbi:MAG: hypothetical protein U1E45_05315 [Geminicoccaceae bacterium]
MTRTATSEHSLDWAGHAGTGGDNVGLVERVRRWFRYEWALHQLGKLESWQLDDVNICRSDFPALAWRYALGLPPVTRLR